MRVLGVDAYRKGSKGGKGWIGVELDRGAFVDAHIADCLTKLLSAVNDIQAVGIDMPLGLVETDRARRISTPESSWANAATASS